MFGREAGEAEGADGGGEGEGRSYDGVGGVGFLAYGLWSSILLSGKGNIARRHEAHHWPRLELL